MSISRAELFDLSYSGLKDYPDESRRLRALVEERRPGARTWLDVACGTGRHLELLRDAGYEVQGLDLDEELLVGARQRLGEDVPLHLGDMTSFELNERFDIVTCLFRAIGEVTTWERTQAAIERMAAHLNPGGMLIIEPFFSRDGFRWPDHVSMETTEENGVHMAKAVRIKRESENVVTLDFQYLVATLEGITHIAETLSEGLFNDDELIAAMEAVGLKAEMSPYRIFPENRGILIGERI